MTQYHITYNAPIEPHWPNGSWSVYRITGDEIAQRVVYERREGDVYTGKVVARHSWCGYVGMVATLPEVAALIAIDHKE